ncbi:MAG: hypothetical protein ACRDRY_01755, partial [Pseudonocardiaceae bacterium]
PTTANERYQHGPSRAPSHRPTGAPRDQPKPRHASSGWGETPVGFDLLIAFEKRCSNYHFTAAGQPLLATLVYVPELEETFLEIETIVDSETKVEPALGVMRQVLGELEIDRNDETIETYTEAVSARRSKP